MVQSGENESDLSPRQEYQQELSESDTQQLLEEYKEVGKEVRYRDGLMHNSYYLLAIAVVFFLGNIISWTDGRTSKIVEEFPDFVFLFGLSSGLLLIFIATVMRTYNDKRVNAEYRRRDVEEALNRKENEEDVDVPLLGIQQEVLDGNPAYLDDDPSLIGEWMDTFADVKGGDYSIWLAVTGVSLFLSGLISIPWMIA